MRTNFYKNKNILVIGGAGFIGSNLVIELVKKGANVLLMDSMINKYGGNLYNLKPVINKIRINFSDLRDTYTLPYLLKDINIIFALAGQVSHLESMKDPFTDLEINCKSQLSLLETCIKLNIQPKIIFASTRQIYGKPKYLPVNEEHPLQPVDINGINKLSGEMYYNIYHKVYGFQTVILRLTNTYGPRMLIKNKNQGFLPIWIGRALNKKIINVYGSGNQLRDFNYVSDVVDALLIAGENNNLIGSAYNLGHHKIYSLLDIIKYFKKIINVRYKIIPFPEEQKKIDIGNYYSDYKKFKSLTGWNPKMDLYEGLKKTFNYYRRHKKYYL